MWSEAMHDLQGLDGISALSISVKAVTYFVTLLAVGSCIVPIILRKLDEETAKATRRLGAISLVIALIGTMSRTFIRSSFLAGGTWDGVIDLELIQIVLDSPLGDSSFVRVIGLALLLGAIFLPQRPKILMFTGAVVVCFSFSLRGHALNDPTYLYAGLITLHTVALSYWIGGFYPLYRLAGDMPEFVGDVTEEFGKYALWAVVSLVAVGGIFVLLLVGNPLTLFTNTYGQLFIMKMLIFAGLLGLAAINKISLTPALLAGDPRAGKAIQLSIKLEVLAFMVILFITATFTTIASPE